MTDTTPTTAGARHPASRPALVLHGGGGPLTVAGLAQHLTSLGFAVTAPTHPGWNGTDRPSSIESVADLTTLYADLLDQLDLRDVLVVGSSLGGWIGADLATHDAPSAGGAGRITGLVLIDAVGIEVPTAPIRDFFGLDARGVAEFAWHDSDRFYVDPATVPAAQQAAQRANMATMAALTAHGMYDPTLPARLGDIAAPTLVVWGESDGIVTPAYGAAFAAAIPDARLDIIAQAGHLPHLEQPEATLAALDSFLAAEQPLTADH